MISIFWKEVNAFFSSLIGYIVVGSFLVILGLVLFVFPDTSLLNFSYASLDQLFDLAPMIFMFLIPAITMRSFADEIKSGTESETAPAIEATIEATVTRLMTKPGSARVQRSVRPRRSAKAA